MYLLDPQILSSLSMPRHRLLKYWIRHLLDCHLTPSRGKPEASSSSVTSPINLNITTSICHYIDQLYPAKIDAPKKKFNMKLPEKQSSTKPASFLMQQIWVTQTSVPLSIQLSQSKFKNYTIKQLYYNQFPHRLYRVKSFHTN